VSELDTGSKPLYDYQCQQLTPAIRKGFKMYEFCANCQKELPTGQRVDSKFCSVSCKDEHHNEIRKARRAEKRALEALDQLRQILEAGGEKALIARDAIYSIERQAQAQISDLTWKCTDCGQLQFDRPTIGTKCEFCGNKRFSFSIAKNNR
jgi:ribosomal protein S27E